MTRNKRRAAPTAVNFRPTNISACGNLDKWRRVQQLRSAVYRMTTGGGVLSVGLPIVANVQPVNSDTYIYHLSVLAIPILP